MSTISFCATGDSLITRRISTEDNSFKEIASIIQSADVRFTNLEGTVHNLEGYPGAVSGGGWVMATPSMLKDLKEYRFNMIAWANNHTLDFTYGGLEATERNLNTLDFVHAGAGSNLARASEPRYLELPSARVALIAATSNFDRTWIAGAQRPDIIGRPGINPLRHHMTYTVSKEKLEQLKNIAKAIPVNATYNILARRGFVQKDGDDLFFFGGIFFQEGLVEGECTEPNENDMKRILSAISEAKRQSDYVIVSIHSHQPKGENIEEPADFLVNFARRCIDEGAHCVIGHGPHILRGIEIYKDRPIFYSLGNFIFQCETLTHQPQDLYDRLGLGFYNNIADALDKQSNTIGFAEEPEVWESIIPFWKMQDGKLTELILHPIELDNGILRHRRGCPKLSKSEKIIKKIAELSKPFGLSIESRDGIGKVIINQKK
ncbi:CapA family protein [Bacillus cereus group sp. N12]|uniref:CapA family protein n=1 Tax=Bacillus cereus group sp. N12 TaxID=2794586 RepID=UPI0018F6270E|nr:CapA family protein [Bacillus cereus group sp. N12]MBJ8077492.1 CapA family protein [Bacillus cereus group sp. N12]